MEESAFPPKKPQRDIFELVPIRASLIVHKTSKGGGNMPEGEPIYGISNLAPENGDPSVKNKD